MSQIEYNIQWDDIEDEYYVDVPIGNQTLHMAFQEVLLSALLHYQDVSCICHEYK